MKKKENPSGMTAEGLERRRAYQRAYRKQNPEKVKQWQRNYWNRKAQQREEVKNTNGK